MHLFYTHFHQIRFRWLETNNGRLEMEKKGGIFSHKRTIETITVGLELFSWTWTRGVATKTIKSAITTTITTRNMNFCIHNEHYVVQFLTT